MTTKTHIEKLRALVDNERMRATALELVDDLKSDGRLDEFADAIATYRDAVEVAFDAIDEWTNTEGEDRETRADARERAIEALDELVQAWDSLDYIEPVDHLPTDPGPEAARAEADR